MGKPRLIMKEVGKIMTGPVLIFTGARLIMTEDGLIMTGPGLIMKSLNLPNFTS